MSTPGSAIEDDGEMADPDEEPLSDRLDAWLGRAGANSLGALVDEFGPQSFALLFLILMAFPALPLPTGGVSHVLEIATMLLALELLVGRREVWLPGWLKRRQLGALRHEKFRTGLIKRIRWVERFTRPRFTHLLDFRVTRAVIGAVVVGLALTAFLAPPFSGLDTLPSLGVVVISLGMLFRDVVIVGVGIVLGAIGSALVVVLGAAIARAL
jgi:hypothetical protein